MTGLPRRRASLSRLRRYLADGLIGLGLCLGPMLLTWTILEPADPIGEGGPDDDEPAAAAHAEQPAAPLTAAEHAAWMCLVRDLGSPAASAPPDPADGPVAPRSGRFRPGEGGI
jgi:hypothetical protein